MRVEEFFLHTHDELAARLEPAPNREYHLLRAAALVRQLILDGQTLVDLVNRTHRLDIRYRVSAQPRATAGGPVLFSYTRIDPSGGDVDELTCKEFLRRTAVHHADLDVTVADFVRYCANVAGGVHRGVAKSDVEKYLDSFGDFDAGGPLVVLPNAPATMLGIGRVVHAALVPLRTAVERGPLPVRRNAPQVR